MRSEFLAGFVKKAFELGHTEETISSVWKSAMAHPELQSYYSSLPENEKIALDVEDLEVLSNVKNVMDKSAEVKLIKEALAKVCE